MQQASSPPVTYLPICGLTTFVVRWTIKGRVVDKSTKQPLKNGNSLFHIDIVDKQGDAIRAKFWGLAAEKWFEHISKGKVYSFRGGRVVVANKRFSNIPHNYELTFDASSEINELQDEDDIGSTRSYNFTNLRDVRNSTRETPFMVDLLVILKNVGPMTKVTTRRSGAELPRRTLTVVDSSEFEFEVTLWNQLAELPDSEYVVDGVLVLNDVQVKEWNGGRSGQTTSSTELNFKYAGDKVDELQTWYSKSGKSKAFQTMRNMDGSATAGNAANSNFSESTLGEMRQEVEGGKLDTERVYIIYGCRVRRFMFTRTREGTLKICYSSCPTCKKKLVSEGGSGWSCAYCDTTVDKPMSRYMVSAQVCDYTNQISLKTFHDGGAALVGASADKLLEHEAKGEKEKVEQILGCDAIFRPFKVFVKARREVYNGEERLQYLAMKADVQSFATAATEMLTKIRAQYPNATEFSTSRKNVKRSEDSSFTESALKKAKVQSPVIQESQDTVIQEAVPFDSFAEGDSQTLVDTQPDEAFAAAAPADASSSSSADNGTNSDREPTEDAEMEDKENRSEGE